MTTLKRKTKPEPVTAENAALHTLHDALAAFQARESLVQKLHEEQSEIESTIKHATRNLDPHGSDDKTLRILKEQSEALPTMLASAMRQLAESRSTLILADKRAVLVLRQHVKVQHKVLLREAIAAFLPYFTEAELARFHAENDALHQLSKCLHARHAQCFRLNTHTDEQTQRNRT